MSILKCPLRYALLLIILIGSITLCFAQMNKSADELAPRPEGEFNPTSWKEYSSAEGRFSILFPGTPKEGVQSIDVQGGQFKIHVHNLKAYAEYGVIYADYPIPVGDLNVAKQVLDNGAKGAVAEVNAELLSMTEISIDEYPGRMLIERLPNGSILRAKMYLVGQRLYQIAVTMPRADTTADSGKSYEAFADKFLDSFRLTTDPKAKGEVDRLLDKENVLVSGPKTSQGTIIQGSIVKGKLISRPLPAYPAEAASAGWPSGTIAVKVVIDERGKVIAAQAGIGHYLLKEAAVEAARHARFTPTLIDNKPIKVLGVINYNFENRK